MNKQEKVKQLINTKTAENNCLAMLLMLNTQKMSFEDAFSKLLFLEVKGKFIIAIADIKIEYNARFGQVIDVPAYWGQVTRDIYFKNTRIKDGYKHIEDMGEDLAWSIMNNHEEMNLDNIHKYLIAITPIVKELFYEMIA